MHVDDLIDMAIRLNVIKDDSDLSENTFFKLVHFVEDMYNETPNKNANPMDYFHKAAFRYRLVADNVLADAWDINEYNTYLKSSKADPSQDSSTEDLVMVKSIKQLRHPVKKPFNMNGWKTIPSMSDLKITLDEYNIELARLGFNKRLPSTLEFIGTKNSSMNHYMIHSIKRLDKLILEGKTKEYWNVCRHLLKHSISFRTSAINKVLPNWWHSISLEKVARIVRRVEEILSIFDTLDNDTNLIYVRQYLQEPTKIRPLGVPAPEWRIVMHMVNNFLVQFLRKDIESWNHGFIPQRGTLSAIKDLIHSWKKYNFIYEFDFKNFFGNVDALRVTDLIYAKREKPDRIPHYLTYWLEKVNLRLPMIPRDVKLDMDKQARINLDVVNKMAEVNHHFDFTKGFPYGGTMKSGHMIPKIKTKASEPKGLPQGLNTSPILSIYSIFPWIKSLRTNGITPKMFADDGHLMGNQRFNPYPPEGHKFHENKSRWVKETYYGETWTMSESKTVIYLGVELDFNTETISGKTRSGKNLKFSMEAENLTELLGKLHFEKYGYNRSKLENISSSGVWGFILSKLYNGTWGKLSYEDKRWRQHKDSWWVQINGGKKFNVKKRDRVRHRGLSSEAVNVLIEIIKKSMTKSKEV